MRLSATVLYSMQCRNNAKSALGQGTPVSGYNREFCAAGRGVPTIPERPQTPPTLFE